MTDIRRNEDGTLDEIVSDKCQFHLEQMMDEHWWMEVITPDGSIHVNLHSTGKITAIVDDERGVK